MNDTSAPLSELLLPNLLTPTVPGAIVAICDRAGIVWHHGHGHADSGRAVPVDLDTVFGLGSVTKTFTAAGILTLRDEGSLSLDDAVHTILPEARALHYPTTDCAPITVRHLLTHTAGLPRGVRDLRGPLRGEPNEEELLDLLPMVKFERPPHVERADSNLGYALLGLILVRRSGVPFHVFMEERLKKPLGMDAATFDAKHSGERLATPHKNRGGTLGPNNLREHNAFIPAEGLYASARDLAKWVVFQLAAWPPRDDPDPGIPLRRSTVRESHRMGGLQRVGRNNFAFGWSIERGIMGDLVWQGLPQSVGYSAFAAFEPDVGVGIVALANAEIDFNETMIRTLHKFAVSRGLIEDRRR